MAFESNVVKRKLQLGGIRPGTDGPGRGKLQLALVFLPRFLASFSGGLKTGPYTKTPTRSPYTKKIEV